VSQCGRGRLQLTADALLAQAFGRPPLSIEVEKQTEETIVIFSRIMSRLKEGLEAQQRELDAARPAATLDYLAVDGAAGGAKLADRPGEKAEFVAREQWQAAVAGALVASSLGRRQLRGATS
jgi:hypothetical protein